MDPYLEIPLRTRQRAPLEVAAASARSTTARDQNCRRDEPTRRENRPLQLGFASDICDVLVGAAQDAPPDAAPTPVLRPSDPRTEPWPPVGRSGRAIRATGRRRSRWSSSRGARGYYDKVAECLINNKAAIWVDKDGAEVLDPDNTLPIAPPGAGPDVEGSPGSGGRGRGAVARHATRGNGGAPSRAVL